MSHFEVQWSRKGIVEKKWHFNHIQGSEVSSHHKHEERKGMNLSCSGYKACVTRKVVGISTLHLACLLLSTFSLWGERSGERGRKLWVLFQNGASYDFCCSGAGGNSDWDLVCLQFGAGLLLAALWVYSRDCNPSVRDLPGCLRGLGWGTVFCTFAMHNSLRQACGGGKGRGEIEMKSLSGYTWPTQLYRFIFWYYIVLSLRDL